MHSVEDMLRHHHVGLTIAKSAAATGSSAKTVTYLLGRACIAIIGWPLADGMGVREL